MLIAWNGQDPKTVIADDSGHWTYTAPLQGGSNQFDITAENLDTSHASATVRRIVAGPDPHSDAARSQRCCSPRRPTGHLSRAER